MCCFLQGASAHPISGKFHFHFNQWFTKVNLDHFNLFSKVNLGKIIKFNWFPILSLLHARTHACRKTFLVATSLTDATPTATLMYVALAQVWCMPTPKPNQFFQNASFYLSLSRVNHFKCIPTNFCCTMQGLLNQQQQGRSSCMHVFLHVEDLNQKTNCI